MCSLIYILFFKIHLAIILFISAMYLPSDVNVKPRHLNLLNCLSLSLLLAKLRGFLLILNAIQTIFLTFRDNPIPISSLLIIVYICPKFFFWFNYYLVQCHHHSCFLHPRTCTSSHSFRNINKIWWEYAVLSYTSLFRSIHSYLLLILLSTFVPVFKISYNSQMLSINILII